MPLKQRLTGARAEGAYRCSAGSAIGVFGLCYIAPEEKVAIYGPGQEQRR